MLFLFPAAIYTAYLPSEFIEPHILNWSVGNEADITMTTMFVSTANPGQSQRDCVAVLAMMSPIMVRFNTGG